jgi:hypothetical protein
MPQKISNPWKADDPPCIYFSNGWKNGAIKQMIKVRRLIVVGGPSCAGKTFLLKKIQRGRCSALQTLLEMEKFLPWQYVQANRLHALDRPVIDRLIVHYDFCARHAQNRAPGNIHDLMRSADQTVLLTLHASHKILARRMTTRLLGELLIPMAPGKKSRRISSLYEKRKRYTKGTDIAALYRTWFERMGELTLHKHWILQTDRFPLPEAVPYSPETAQKLSNYQPEPSA